MAFASIKITGAKELERKLKTLEPKIGRKIVKQSLREGAKIFKARIKAAAPVGRTQNRTRVKKTVATTSRQKGYMRRSITVRAATKNRRGTYAVMTTFDTRRFPSLIVKSRAGKRYFYPAAVEYGHKGAPAHPFIRPAFDAVGRHAERRVLRKMAQGIERVAKQ